MEVALPKVVMPVDFLTLLKGNRISVASDMNQLLAHIRSNPSFNALLRESFQEFDESKRLDIIIKNLGWENFRDRVASLYLYHNENKFFPPTTDLELVEDISDFEKRIEKHSVQNFSRGFLLMFYFKMGKLITTRRVDGESKFYLIPEDVFELLKYSKVKTVKIDWLILTLWHFVEYLGRNKVQKHLEDETCDVYRTLFNALKHDEKYTMIENLLAYGQSIDEPELFKNEDVI